MAEAARTPGTGGCAAVAIYAELETASMDIVSQRLYSAWEALGICLYETIGIALAMPCQQSSRLR